MLRGEIFEGKKRMTSGLLFKASQLGLDSNVINSQEQKEIIVFDTRALAQLKAVEEYTIRKATALEITALNKLIADLGVKVLKALVHYNKIKYCGDVPSTKKYILERYEAICCRADQTLETYLSSCGHQ